MNTLEMMRGAKRGLAHRLPIWTDKDLRIVWDRENDRFVFVTDKGQSKSSVYFLDFIDIKDWEEYKPKVMYSELTPGETFNRPGYTTGPFIKLNTHHFKYQPHYYSVDKSVLYCDEDNMDFEVERVTT